MQVKHQICVVCIHVLGMNKPAAQLNRYVSASYGHSNAKGWAHQFLARHPSRRMVILVTISGLTRACSRMHTQRCGNRSKRDVPWDRGGASACGVGSAPVLRHEQQVAGGQDTASTARPGQEARPGGSIWPVEIHHAVLIVRVMHRVRIQPSKSLQLASPMQVTTWNAPC